MLSVKPLFENHRCQFCLLFQTFIELVLLGHFKTPTIRALAARAPVLPQRYRRDAWSVVRRYEIHLKVPFHGCGTS